jgi:hypothetical protein
MPRSSSDWASAAAAMSAVAIMATVLIVQLMLIAATAYRPGRPAGLECHPEALHSWSA